MPKKANLGLATTGEMLTEIRTRLRVDGQLDRRTVNDDQPTGQPAEAHVRELLEDEDGAPLPEAMQQAWNAVRDIATTVAQVQARRYRAAADAVIRGAYEAGEPPSAARKALGGELIGRQLERERDDALHARNTYGRELDRARLRINQQDRQLAAARERDQANVTRWRDAEERLQRVMEQRDRLNDHARDLQQRLDISQTPMINANQQLRLELEQVIRERDQAKQTRDELADQVAELEKLPPIAVRVQRRMAGLEAQLAEANRTIARLAPF